MTQKRLTAHQSDVLSIVEDGGVEGVAFESVVREITGRFTSDIHTTIYSLQRRGLVEVWTVRTRKMGAYGEYIHEARRVKVAR